MMSWLKPGRLIGLVFGLAAALPAEYGFRPAGTEIVELADAVSRHYSNGDGTITAVIAARPVWMQAGGDNRAGAGGEDTDVALPTFEYDYATGYASTDGSQYAKTGVGLIKVEREVSLQPPSRIERVGWAKFDLASLPESVRITGVALARVIAYFELTMGLSYRTLTLDPVTADAQQLYQAIQGGAVCYDGERGRLFDTIDLGAVGVQHVQQALNRNWVAFGIVGTGYSTVVTKRVWIIGWNNQPRSDSPWLLVTYEPPTAVEEAGPMLNAVKLSVVPNPVTDGFALLRAETGSGFDPEQEHRQVSVRLFDALGHQLLQTAASIGNTTGTRLDLRRIPAGTCFLCVEAAGQKTVQKVVIR